MFACPDTRKEIESETRRSYDLEKSVNEWRNSGALREDHEPSEQQQHNHHRGEPPPFGFPEEKEQISCDA
jgi:hypothetical protein